MDRLGKAKLRKSQRRSRLALVTGILALMLSGCRSTATPPNILLIVIDTLRADHLGAYGYGRPTSPTFDALARQGLLFTRAHSVTSWTNPSVAALLTGETPRAWEPSASSFIVAAQTTLAERLRDRGYKTAAVVANPVLGPDLGFARGFDSYVGVSGWAQGLAAPPKQPGERINKEAMRWLATSHDEAHRPWFLFLNYMDTHWPYRPPVEKLQAFWRSADVDAQREMEPLNRRVRERVVQSPQDVAQATDLYDAAVAHVDSQLRELFAALEASNELKQTIVCILADHGEELGDHGRFLHAHTLYEELLRIPLLLILPQHRLPQRNDSLVQITDVAPLLLNLTQGDPTAVNEAKLVAFSHQGPLQAELVGATVSPSHRRALLNTNEKLIETTDGQYLLFDLSRDPNEQSDLAAARGDRVAALRAAIAPSISTQTGTRAGDDALHERMRALGYDF